MARLDAWRCPGRRNSTSSTHGRPDGRAVIVRDRGAAARALAGAHRRDRAAEAGDRHPRLERGLAPAPEGHPYRLPHRQGRPRGLGARERRAALTQAMARKLTRRNSSTPSAVWCAARGATYRRNENRSPSGSPRPVIWFRSICAANAEKVMPLPPYPRTAWQCGMRGTGPMDGVPVSDAPKLPHHA